MPLLRKASLYGITYVLNDELVISFVEAVSGRYRMIGQEKIPLESAGTLDTGMISEFRKKISGYQTRKPTWIHLVLRNVSLVKVFSLPETNPDQLDQVISNRIQAEIPYLSEEVILHQVIQEGDEGGRTQVLLFGVSKNVLSDQMKKLEAYGIVPNRITLSTEILAWLYRTRIMTSEKLERHTVFVHVFAGQIELLFFEEYRLLQSRWISQDGQPAFVIQEAVEASLASYQREWRRKPDMVLMAGDSHVLEMLQFDQSFIVKQVPLEKGEEALFLFGAVIASRQSDEVFDYTLPMHKEIREQIHKTESYSKLTISVMAFAIALLLMAIVEIGVILSQMGWFNYQSNTFSNSVREVKKMRESAVNIRDFYQKKIMPLVVLEQIRDVIPEDMLLTELEYDEDQADITISGTAPQQAQIDQLVSKLGKEALFKSVKLERVQSERSNQGALVYNFTITCLVKLSAG